MTATLDRSMTKKRANAPRKPKAVESRHAVYARGARRYDHRVPRREFASALMVPPDVYSVKKELLISVDCALLTDRRRPRDGGPRCAAPRPGHRQNLQPSRLFERYRRTNSRSKRVSPVMLTSRQSPSHRAVGGTLFREAFLTGPHVHGPQHTRL